MQPYFFPYVGYWQLIHAADCFVLFDDAQYIRHGWINRNRILKPGGGWQYILVPLQKHAATDPIEKIRAHPEKPWRELILGQLAHYRKKARYFRETSELVSEALYGTRARDIARINLHVIERICEHLGMNREILLSSEQNFDYRDVTDAGEWALQISQQMGAEQYINPAAGAKLFDPEKFSANKIALSFLESREIHYRQVDPFEPSLSIIDVLMFNGIEGTRQIVESYTVEACSR